MRKITPKEGLTLLRLYEGELSFITVEPDDVGTHEALTNLHELGLIDAYAIDLDVITTKGKERIHQMLAFGINYKEHFKNASIGAKQAAFLSLINSGYEPRGLWSMLFKKGNWSHIKNAFYQVKNTKL